MVSTVTDLVVFGNRVGVLHGNKLGAQRGNHGVEKAFVDDKTFEGKRN